MSEAPQVFYTTTNAANTVLWTPTLTAAAAAPLKPPLAWFEMPEADSATPLTVTKEGQVYGHLALWDTCHTGFLNGRYAECVQAPRSQTDYSLFHLGKLETDQGDVSVGKLTYDTSHAPITVGLQAASRHYDETGSVGAFVRASDGKYGIWLSGAVRSDISPEGLRDLRANPPSGDWRALNRSLELIASLAVVVPGLPIPRSQLALAASASGELEVSALILPGYCDCEGSFSMDYTTEQQRKKRMLHERVLTAAVLTSEKRQSLPKTSFALPGERRYPIHDLAHARNALARSAGKPEEATVRRAVCKRYPQLCKS